VNLTDGLGSQQALLSLRLPVLRASLACNISSDANLIFKRMTSESCIGDFKDLHVGPADANGGWEYGEYQPFDTNPAGCPSLALAFGYVNESKQTSSLALPPPDVTLMTCYQLMQEIEASHFFSSRLANS
jgi:hypothetical protein